MKNLYRYLALVALSIGTAACQTDSVNPNVHPEPPDSLLDVRPPETPNSGYEFRGANETVLVPQQYGGCAVQGQDSYYGYTFCMEYNTGFWWLIWPHGHGYDSCLYTVWMEGDGGRWSPWIEEYNYEICN